MVFIVMLFFIIHLFASATFINIGLADFTLPMSMHPDNLCRLTTIGTNENSILLFRFFHKKNCKPISRILFPDKSGHLSFICSAYPSCNRASSPKQDLFGISTHKVCPTTIVANCKSELLPHFFTFVQTQVSG